MNFLRWLRTVEPGEAFKWGVVVFAYCLAILFLISVALAIAGSRSA